MSSDAVQFWLATLEQAIAAVPTGSIRYEEAMALFRRLDALVTDVDTRLVCAAPIESFDPWQQDVTDDDEEETDAPSD